MENKAEHKSGKNRVYKVGLPLLSKETLAEISFGMENQYEDFVLCLNDGNVYSGENLEENFDDDNNLDSLTFVPLPEWSSANGYRLMCSFVQVCDDKVLKERLTEVLNSKQKGVFRRFKEILESKPDALKDWFAFKDKRMFSYIRSWYKDVIAKSSLVSSEKNDMPLEEDIEGSLMVTYDVEQKIVLDEQNIAMLESLIKEDTVAKKVLCAFESKEALCAYKDGLLSGQVVFEVVGDTACVLSYNVEESCRHIGLFELLFDLLNREFERRGVLRVVFPIPSAVLALKDMFSSHDVAIKPLYNIGEYAVSDWTSAVETAEIAYLL